MADPLHYSGEEVLIMATPAIRNQPRAHAPARVLPTTSSTPEPSTTRSIVNTAYTQVSASTIDLGSLSRLTGLGRFAAPLTPMQRNVDETLSLGATGVKSRGSAVNHLTEQLKTLLA